MRILLQISKIIPIENASEMHVDAPKTQEYAVTESQVNNIDKTVDNEIELAPRHKKDDQTNLSVNSFENE